MKPHWVRALSQSLHPWASRLRALPPRAPRPFLCVVTPVFDDALEPFKLLVEALRRQTFRDFVHVATSNGASPGIRDFVAGLGDRRFLYEEVPEAPTPDHASLLANLGLRRRTAVGGHDAERYVFFDADLKLLDDGYFAKLYIADRLGGDGVILAKVRYYDQEFPVFPVARGRIDMANFSFSRRTALEHPYPTDTHPDYPGANDFRFFESIAGNGGSALLLEDLVAEKDGNKGYRRASDRQIAERLASGMISVFGNTFVKADAQAVADVLHSHYVGSGPRTREFEQRFAGQIGFRHGVALQSATSAFWLLAQALDLGRDSEVLLPNLHFHGLPMALDLLGVPWRVCDVGKEAPNADVESLMQALTPRTRAVVLLDHSGWPADGAAVRERLRAAGRGDVRLILDAANSPFTRRDGAYVARDYDAAFYSFDMNKMLVTGDGGMVLTDDAALADRLRRLAFYGLSPKASSGWASAMAGRERWWELQSEGPGLKLLMNDIAAALGIGQLARIRDYLLLRDQLRRLYRKRLAPLAERGLVTLPPHSARVENDVYLFWIKLRDGAQRDALARRLLEQRIYTTVKYQPLKADAPTPNAHDFWQRALCLPMHQNIKPQLADYVMTCVREFLAQAGSA